MLSLQVESNECFLYYVEVALFRVFFILCFFIVFFLLFLFQISGTFRLVVEGK